MSLLTYRVEDLEFAEEASYPYTVTEALLGGARAVRSIPLQAILYGRC